MDAAEVLKKENIILGLFAEDKEEVISRLCNLLLENGALTDKQAFEDDVKMREATCSTAIGNAIAIPHGKSAHVKETTAAVARLANPVKWSAEDDEVVSFVVLLAVNENDKGTSHVRLLSQMARKLASEEACAKLMSANGREEIIKIFS